MGEAKNNHHAGTWSQQSTTQSEQISQVNLCQFNDSAGVSLNSQGSSMNESTVSSQKVRQCSSISNKVRQFSEKLVIIIVKYFFFKFINFPKKVHFFMFVNVHKSTSIFFQVRQFSQKFVNMFSCSLIFPKFVNIFSSSSIFSKVRQFSQKFVNIVFKFVNFLKSSSIFPKVRQFSQKFVNFPKSSSIICKFVNVRQFHQKVRQ